MLGSGFPLAIQMSDTLLPSFTVMSEEMSYILGGTTKKEKENRNTQDQHSKSVMHGSFANITFKWYYIRQWGMLDILSGDRWVFQWGVIQAQNELY